MTLCVFLGAGCDRKPPPPATSKSAAAAEPQVLPPAPVRKTMPKSPEWSQVEKLASEQKYDEAQALVRTIRQRAQKVGEDAAEEWTAALLREVQLELALSGFESAVRLLREQPWPKDALSQLALELHYAHSLTVYLQAYSWEIGQREKVASKAEVDLKSWSKAQIVAEAQHAYQRLWERRLTLSQAPLSLLKPHLEPNDYPPAIRDTLRDALSYFAVELLTNSQHFTPEESNSLYLLDVPALIKGGASAGAVNLDDPTLHPLVRAMAVLDDLEAFHRQQGQLEAALEARLTRVRTLRSLLTDAGDRERLRAHLTEILPAYRKLPWWAMGMATLAELLKQDDHDLVRAHAVASDGAAAYPDTPGGKSCANLKATIEAPSYSLASMTVDAPGKRSLAVSHQNIGTLYFRAYEFDLKKRLLAKSDVDLLDSEEVVQPLIKKGKPAAAWQVELPATPDYQTHRTYVTPPLAADQRGSFVIVASLLPDFREGKNHIGAVLLTLSDLVMVSRPEAGSIDATTVAGSTGAPVAGAEVTLYQTSWNKKPTRAAGAKSDGQGRARLSPKRTDEMHFLFAEHGKDRAYDPEQIYLDRPDKPGRERRTLIYTDRSIYRPNQKIAWKVVAYSGVENSGRYQVAPQAKLTVDLLDANYQVVESAKVTTNAFGSAAGTFATPANRVLGQWTIRTSSYDGSAAVRVEEYKRPTFEVSLKDPPEALRLNQPATLTGEARYYFGQSVTAGSVRYRVTRRAISPWWWGMWGLPFSASAEVVASGEAKLGGDGGFRITFTPKADERKSKDFSYSYALSADVTDEGGETRSASRSFRVGFVTVEARIEAESGFFNPGGGQALAIHRTSLDGVGRAGEGTFRLLAIAQPEKTLAPSELPVLEAPNVKKSVAPFKTPGDKLRPRWDRSYAVEAVMASWPDGKELASGKLRHDEKGNAELRLIELPPGAYRLRYETQDEFQNRAETWHNFIVAGPAPKLSLPLYVIAQEDTVKVGGTARILIGSGFDKPTIYVERLRDGKRVESFVKTAGEILELPIREADRGGFSLSVYTVVDHQYLREEVDITVPWDNKELALSFASFRDTLRPGAKETFQIKVKSPSGAALTRGVAELLAYMYDRSLELFGRHAPPQPLSLYPSYIGAHESNVSLGESQIDWVHRGTLTTIPERPVLMPDRLPEYSSYGIGGMGGYGGGPRGRIRAFASAAPGAPPMAEASRALAKEDKKANKSEREVDSLTESPKAKAEAKPTEPRQAPDTGNKKVAAEPAAPKEAVRENFAETAFFAPTLLTDDEGSATIEFTVPDSVTSWKVWAHAITRDLQSGSLSRETRSVKELMVRPYLPRFFREGDSAALKVVVNNTAARPLEGTLRIEITDADDASLPAKSLIKLFQIGSDQQPFKVEPNKSTTLSFPLSAPSRVGTYAFKVVASAGDFSDGELRPLPVLPSRMHLSQSRFVTLRDKDSRTMSFADLKDTSDPTRIDDQLVVTLDTQLFYTVLKALPYLAKYPYECVEQTLNRFLSAGIVSSLYGRYPTVKKMAAEFSQRKTPLERFDQNDPNRKMTMEESPWLVASRGGEDTDEVINLLHPATAEAQTSSALRKLKKTQTASGGFPWFPGGPPSEYMTLYVLHGFARASEFQVSGTREMAESAWRYLAQRYRTDYAKQLEKEKKDCCWESLTFLNYVASAYPDAASKGAGLNDEERQAILAHSFKHWKEHSPYLKGLLALTLKRMGREADAKLVFASVMDSAKSAPDQGVFWAREDRSWLWYNDTIESHAFALRVLLELDPENAKKDGLVLWLLLNKKLNQWKSTRATAEVIYSLVQYLKREGALGTPEEATVHYAGKSQLFEFPADRYIGKTQLVIPGADLKVDPAAHATIRVEKATKGLMFASSTWHFSTEKLPSEGSGDFFFVTRTYYKRELVGSEYVLKPLAEGTPLKLGDEVEVQLSLRSKHAAEYVHLRDPRAAGLEPEGAVSRYRWDLGVGCYEEIRDSGANYFFEQLPAGEYTFKYRLRVNLAGSFRVGPATVQSMYAPEFSAYSAGHKLEVAGSP